MRGPDPGEGPAKQPRWRRAARILLAALGVVAAGIVWIQLEHPVSAAIAHAELAVWGGGRLVLDVDLDRGPQDKVVLERVRKTIASRLEKATGHTVLVHAEGSRLHADLPPRALAQLRRVMPRLDGLEKLLVPAKVELTIVDDADSTVARLSGLPPGVTVDWDHYEGAGGAIVTAPYLTSKDAQALLVLGKDRAPPGRVLAVSLRPDQSGKYRTYLLQERAALTGDEIRDARVAFDQPDGKPRPYVSVGFSKRGTQMFADLTARNVFRRVAIVFDGRVESAPIVQSAIPTGYCSIHLGGVKPVKEQLQEAKDLSLLLTSGALAAPVRLVSVEPLRPAR